MDDCDFRLVYRTAVIDADRIISHSKNVRERAAQGPLATEGVLGNRVLQDVLQLPEDGDLGVPRDTARRPTGR